MMSMITDINVPFCLLVVEMGRIELPTYGLPDRRSPAELHPHILSLFFFADVGSTLLTCNRTIKFTWVSPTAFPFAWFLNEENPVHLPRNTREVCSSANFPKSRAVYLFHILSVVAARYLWL